EAAEIGLIHRVVAEDELQEEAFALAHRLAARSPFLNQQIKRMVYDAGTRPAGAAARMEAASMIAAMTTSRARQDMETYLEKLARHDAPSDRDILGAWAEMLAAAGESP